MKAEEIIKENLPLVKSIANRYKNYGVPLEDLIQDGLIGLWESIEKYDASKGAKLSTYATYWIKKKILESVEKESKTSLDAINLDENIKIPQQKNNITPQNNEQTIDLPKDFPILERKVLTLLYGLDGNDSYDLTQISKILNFPREKVRQIKEKGIRRLKKIQKHKSV